MKSLDLWKKSAVELQEYSWGERLLNAIPKSTEEMPFSGNDVTAYVAGLLSSVTGVIGAAIIIVFLRFTSRLILPRIVKASSDSFR